MIFSLGQVETDSTDITPILRWSPFFSLEEQFHFDFSKLFGIYTGLGIRNVGLISHINATFVTDTFGNTSTSEVTVKERSYSLGLPLAIKLGNLEDGTYFSIGAEAEIMFAWKRKIMDGNNKVKTDAWFDDHVNIFNPSIFTEVHFGKATYVRFKYYLLDFLNYQGITLTNQNYQQTYIADYGPVSPLFYISIGSINLKKTVDKSTQPAKTETKSAYFKLKQHNVVPAFACSSVK